MGKMRERRRRSRPRRLRCEPAPLAVRSDPVTDLCGCDSCERIEAEAADNLVGADLDQGVLEVLSGAEGCGRGLYPLNLLLASRRSLCPRKPWTQRGQAQRDGPSQHLTPPKLRSRPSHRHEEAVLNPSGTLSRVELLIPER